MKIDPDPTAAPIMDRTWMRRLILLDMVLVAFLGWLLWSVYKGNHQAAEKRQNPPPEIEEPAESGLEGLDY